VSIESPAAGRRPATRLWRSAAPLAVGIVVLALWQALVQVNHVPPLEAGYRLTIPRLFAAPFLLSATGIAIYFAIDCLSRFALRHWHESAVWEADD